MAAIATWVCWGIVVATWIVGAVLGARGSHGRRQPLGGGAAWRLASVVALVVVIRFAGHELRRVTDHSLWIEIPGLMLLVVSTAFTIWARVRLGRMWSAMPNTLQTNHELRTDGPYAITRHPIYTGLLGMILGTVLLNGLGLSLAFLAVGAAIVATRIPIEERLMSSTFPAEYALYRERVPRLVPGLQLLRRSH
jgi:protein-S-isoprenylcysteine O-methyltransferase Ste14